ncbi:MAG TPA: lipoyl synthase [Sediminispirochaeta sp.]|nr:lipoyl synthase [Sediminispirochaeta sp.]
MKTHIKKPDWLKVPIRSGENLQTVKKLLKELELNTVCQAANCPNRMECFSQRTATFMILGDTCTRNCRFCNVSPGRPGVPDPEEPRRLAQAVVELGLKHTVITSVTRDDLPDGGAEHFARTVAAIREVKPETTVEVLIPDFKGDRRALATVLAAKPDILNHNLETVPRFYRSVRPQADYQRSLEVLARTKEIDPGMYTKSGIMVGLGETEEEIDALMDDLRRVDCDFITIGQYLPPSQEHYQLEEYVSPETFAKYQRMAYRKGFRFAASSPFVRSSYKAAEMLDSQDQR